jgi:vacuolar protein sorting-associated protein 13A/C
MLENLRLQKDIFQLLGLPFKLKFSKIRKLHVKVPYTKLSSQPVELQLESLIIVISPLARSEWHVEDTWLFDHKKRAIEDFIHKMIEKLKEQTQEAKKGSKSESKEDGGGYWNKKYIKIMDNIQLTIKNIHLRYEDSISIKDNPYSFGFTLQELSIKTTNQ